MKETSPAALYQLGPAARPWRSRILRLHPVSRAAGRQWTRRGTSSRTRRVRLVRGEGRDVSSQYGRGVADSRLHHEEAVRREREEGRDVSG